MPDLTEDRLVADLRALGDTGTSREASPELVAAVVAAIGTVPGPRARGWQPPRRVVLVVLAVLVALVAAPPVRATVADWFGFGGVRVEQGDPVGDAAPPPAAPPGDLDDAVAQVSFVVLVPEALGTPTGIEVSPDERVLSMTWTRADGSVVRLDQFDARLDFAVLKRAPGVEYAAVGASDALWFEEPHEVALYERDGSRRTETARLAGHTLIWSTGPTTLRLEGDLSLDEAVRIAESARPRG